MGFYRYLCKRYRDARRQYMADPSPANTWSLERAHTRLQGFRRVCAKAGLSPFLFTEPRLY